VSAGFSFSTAWQRPIGRLARGTANNSHRSTQSGADSPRTDRRHARRKSEFNVGASFAAAFTRDLISSPTVSRSICWNGSIAESSSPDNPVRMRRCRHGRTRTSSALSRLSKGEELRVFRHLVSRQGCSRNFDHGTVEIRDFLQAELLQTPDTLDQHRALMF